MLPFEFIDDTLSNNIYSMKGECMFLSVIYYYYLSFKSCPQLSENGTCVNALCEIK